MAKVKYKANHQVVIKAGQDAAEAIGKKFGSYVYTTAKQSIRKGSQPAAPGTPPKDKSGTLKKNIVFAYENETRKVVIGPRLLPGRTDAPEALEVGKRTIRRVFVGRGKDTKRVRKQVNIEARPFMRPALEKRLPELPKLWQNAIRK